MARPRASANAATPWGWAWSGALLGLLLALLAYAPARWLGQLVSEASAGRVLLVDARGTVWRGSARLVLTGGADSLDSVALPGRMAWRIRPSSWRQLQLDVNAPCCMAQDLHLLASAGWSRQRLELGDHQSSWPASLLAGLGTPWNTVQAQGQLAARLTGLSVEWLEGRISLAGQVQLDALEMASRLSTLRPIGSYRLSLTGGSVNVLKLETLQGSLQLSGLGHWVGGRLRFDGAASAAPDRAEALSNLLNIIGRRDGMRSVIKVG